MLNRTLVAAALLAGSVPASPLPAQEKIPPSLSSFKPHEIVEAFAAESKSIGLTADQLATLDSMHVAVRDERHRWTDASGNKAHKQRTMKPMISRENAYRDALAVLTPAQREAAIKRFNDPEYVPLVPSLASEVPAALEDLKPHEIVQVFAVEGKPLDLGDDQVEQLQSLHLAVRDEPHRYTASGAPGKAHRSKMMEPMISKRRAYNDALSFLTAEQRDAAVRRFNASGYRAPPLPK